MFVVFASFVLTTSIDLKELGFALAVVVLVDAALTRRLLVPAVLRLLGERAWAGPRAQPAPARSAQAASSGSVVTDGQTWHTVVGTLAEFRPDPVPYDPAALVRFVRGINPDLLCLDMTTQQWQERDFGGLPAEYRDALLPLAEQSDIVVVPIGGQGDEREGTPPGRVVRPGPRGWLLGRLRPRGRRSSGARPARWPSAPAPATPWPSWCST